MFIGRTHELDYLDKCYRDDTFHLIALYGKRRVGKTELLKHFSKEKDVIFFSAEETTNKQNLKKFSKALAFFLGIENLAFEEWSDVFDNIIQISKKKKLVLIIDEFPYLARSNKGILSIIQHLVDHSLKDSNIKIILCGSAIGFMEDEVIAHKSPLYGRITDQILLKPFDYYQAYDFFDNLSHEEFLKVYSIIGGIPHYLAKYDDRLSLKENIKTRILHPKKDLFNSPKSQLQQELRTPNTYFAILEAISEGASKANEIATKIGVPNSTISKYLDTLIKLHIIKKDLSIDQSSSKKALYSFDDNLTNFIFLFGYQNTSLLEQGLIDYVYEHKYLIHFPTYMGHKFESICMQYLKKLNKELKLPFVAEDIGRLWANNPETKSQEEIDPCLINQNHALFVECKFRNQATDLKVLKELLRKSSLLNHPFKHYMVISKSEYTKAALEFGEANNFILKRIDDLF